MYDRSADCVSGSRTTIIRTIPDNDMWMEAFDMKFLHDGAQPLDKAFWNQLLALVSATADMSYLVFFEELQAVYPNVKCILVEREVQQWYRSWYHVQTAKYDSTLFRFVAGSIPPSLSECGASH